jgi:transcriptional regulator with XRE-family HTH domain
MPHERYGLSLMEKPLSGTDNAAIGRRLIATRNAKGMNQRTFALFCGITPQALNNFERGRQRPSLESAGKISSAIGAGLDWVYYGDRSALTDDLAMLIFAPGRNNNQRGAG